MRQPNGSLHSHHQESLIDETKFLRIDLVLLSTVQYFVLSCICDFESLVIFACSFGARMKQKYSRERVSQQSSMCDDIGNYAVFFPQATFGRSQTVTLYFSPGDIWSTDE
mmetsp:Transcript_7712/g.14545  ORF Transcript_7712/g.14545 Transcript_7712/m.14545 type:complete len:110 (+) Transcript_7712:1486-1815(+)